MALNMNSEKNMGKLSDDKMSAVSGGGISVAEGNLTANPGMQISIFDNEEDMYDGRGIMYTAFVDRKGVTRFACQEIGSENFQFVDSIPLSRMAGKVVGALDFSVGRQWFEVDQFMSKFKAAYENR
jgi:hypothetical protein